MTMTSFHTAVLAGCQLSILTIHYKHNTHA